MKYLIIALQIFLAVFVVFGLIPHFLSGFVVYKKLLVRGKKKKWSRDFDPRVKGDLARIYLDAGQWADSYRAYRREVGTENDGLHLHGEYYEFSPTAKRAVIIVPGRTEACRYCCHFAEPYRLLGYNVLTIDNRAHGLSDGRYNEVGFGESRDLIKWGEYLHTECGVEEIILHGICIGACSALFALTNDDCPDYITAMTADGIYRSFYESFRCHLRHHKVPVFPVLQEVTFLLRHIARAEVKNDGPAFRIGKLQKPILFLHSREDHYSLPDAAQSIYDACRAAKELVWFDHGEHSMLRITDPDRYDAAIRAFYLSH